MPDNLPNFLLQIIQNIPLSVWGVLGALLLINVFGKTLLRQLGWRKASHRRKERQARQALAQLTRIPEPARKIAYLRKVDPFVFEEMILEAYEQRGHKVKRNLRYTGDGGIDGRVWLNDQLHLIQAKRYRGHIKADHVREFCQLVATKECGGLFVHTGRTGGASSHLVRANANITIISGRKLLNLLTIPGTEPTPR